MALALTNRRKAKHNPRRKHAKRNVSALLNRKPRRKAKHARRARRNVSALLNRKHRRHHRKARRNVSALLNRRRHHRKAKHNPRRRHARRNVSALMNRRHHRKAKHNPRRHHRKARRNGIMRMNPMRGIKRGAKQTTKFVAMALPWTVGGVAAYAAHAALEQFGATAKIEEYANKIPTAGPYIAAASHTLQGAAAAAVLGMLARFAPKAAKPYIQKTAISAVVIGAAQDSARVWQARSADGKWALPHTAGYGALGFGYQYGALGFGEQYAGIGFGEQHFAGAYGDGLAYELAPLTADYSQASLGDAYHCGADFSPAEGQALINGRGAWMHAYGEPPHHVKSNPAGASHLAGRDGHKWGWLIKTVGWQKAREIAAMAPQKRVAVIQSMREAAAQAFQSKMAQIQAADEARAPEAQAEDMAPVNHLGAQGASGAQGQWASNYGDGALFMGA